MVVRREVIEVIGMLDEQYRHSGEDLDYFVRARRAGWNIRYVSDAEVVHEGGGSTRHAPHRTLMYGILGAHRYYRKNWSARHAVGYRIIISCVRMPVTLLRGLGLMVLGHERPAEFRERLRLAVAMVSFRADGPPLA